MVTDHLSLSSSIIRNQMVCSLVCYFCLSRFISTSSLHSGKAPFVSERAICHQVHHNQRCLPELSSPISLQLRSRSLRYEHLHKKVMSKSSSTETKCASSYHISVELWSRMHKARSTFIHLWCLRSRYDIRLSIKGRLYKPDRSCWMAKKYSVESRCMTTTCAGTRLSRHCRMCWTNSFSNSEVRRNVLGPWAHLLETLNINRIR